MNKLLKITLFYVLFSSLVGCVSAEFVERQYHPERAGVVRYSTAGAMERSRARDAGDLMLEFCNGQRPLILSQSNKSQNAGAYITQSQAMGTQINNYSETYVYVSFKCPKRAKQDNASLE